MLENIITPIGLKSPATAMDEFQKVGNDMLKRLRNQITSPKETKETKELKLWGIVEAAKLVGTTVPTIKRTETLNIPNLLPGRDAKNRRIYDLSTINCLRDHFGTRKRRPNNVPPIVTAVTNFKGGCTKTTTAVHFSQKCALEGLRTLLIDMDPQATATFVLGGILPDLELTHEDTISTALLDDSTDIKNIIRKTHFPGLDIIPSNLALQDCELALPNGQTNNVGDLGPIAYRLKRAIEQVKDNYDNIIIDCGPNLGILTINSIVAANSILIPIPPTMLDYASFVMLTGTLNRLFEALPELTFDLFRILVAKHPGNKQANEVEDMLRGQYKGYVLRSNMCETIEVAKATNNISTIYEMEKPKGNREAYKRAIHHLNNVNTEIIDLFEQVWESKAQSNSDKEKENVNDKA